MLRTTLVVSALTMCVLVPAGLHRLGAGPSEIAALVRPDADQLEIGGGRVEVSVDRSLVEAGGKVRVRLRATADEKQSVKLALIVLEARGTEGDRVPAPPVEILHQNLTLDAIPDGGARREVVVKLRGYTGSNMEGSMAFGQYTVLVLPRASGDELRRQHKKLRREVASSSDEGAGDDGQFWETLYAIDDDVTAARVEVSTYNPSRIAVGLPESVHRGESFRVELVVENPTGKAMRNASVVVSPLWVDGYQGIEPEELEIEPAGATEGLTIAAHGTITVKVWVTAHLAGVFGLHVVARDENWVTFGSALEGIEVLDVEPEITIEEPLRDDAAPVTDGAAVQIAEVTERR